MMGTCAHMRTIMETAVLRRATTDRQWQQAILRVSEGGLGILSQARVAPCAYLASIALTSRLLRARPQLRPVWSSWASGRMTINSHAQRSYTFVRQFYSAEDLDRGALVELADLDAAQSAPSCTQRAFSGKVLAHDRSRFVDFPETREERARVLSCGGEGAGGFLDDSGC